MLRIAKLPSSLTPPHAGQVLLGRTLPALLDEACDRHPNPQAFNQWIDTAWQSLSNQEFRSQAESTALGLLKLGLQKGDRVAFLMHSNVNFCIADIACLLANLVDVPIDLTQTLEHIFFVLRHSATKTLVVSNVDLLTQIVPYLQEAPELQHIIVAEVGPDWLQQRSQWLQQDNATSNGTDTIPESACLDIPMALNPAHLEHLEPNQSSSLPTGIQLFSLEEVQQFGRETFDLERLQQLRAELNPNDLATIIYIPDELGQLQGVMLTHENLSGNALASFSGIANLGHGNQETVLSFLPLNHVLARTMIYGHICYGHSIYFSSANRVMKHLKEVKPSVLVTVPLLLEKIYSKILEKGSKASPDLTYSKPVASGLLFPLSFFQLPQIALTHLIFNWALKLAQQYELGSRPKAMYTVLLKLADWLVLSKWRAVFGGHLRYLICGGAALKAELANVFSAAGVPILHGYGLTQASAVVCCNRGLFNRAGTVGIPIAGMEVAIANDHEILLRGPYITQGYYNNPAATQEMIDPQGWLHTGDLGSFTNEGFLKITGLKKSLFKLCTGKYIAPKPIEQRLQQSSFISAAVIVGSEQKFCGALILPDLEALHAYALNVGIDLPGDALLQHPCILALYQALVDAANCHLPYWATVKRFRLINPALEVANDLLNATQAMNRASILQVFATEIDALYRDIEPGKRSDRSKTSESDQTELSPQSIIACPDIPGAACPAYAQSLNPRLTN